MARRVAKHLDVSESIRAKQGSGDERLRQEGLRDSQDQYASLVELAPIGISHVDPNGRFVYVNPRLCAMLGYSREELLQLSVRQISHPDDRFASDAGRARLHAGEIDSFKLEKRYVRKDGALLWVHLTIAAKRGPDGQPMHDVSIVEDISERREAQARIEYLATHDEMTGLANRTLFNELLARVTARTRRHGGRFAVLFIDLDRFKIVNDSLGHDGGDELLKVLASRFNAVVRSSDAIARFGGDEFVLLVDALPNREAAAVVARLLLSVAIKPVQIGEHECRVTGSVGIAVYPDDATDAQTLMKNADIALYRAKKEGKNTFQFFSPDFGAMAEHQVRIKAGEAGGHPCPRRPTPD